MMFGFMGGGGDFKNSRAVGVFGESGKFNVVGKLRLRWVSLANRWILTQYFELRLLLVSLANLSSLTQCLNFEGCGFLWRISGF